MQKYYIFMTLEIFEVGDNDFGAKSVIFLDFQYKPDGIMMGINVNQGKSLILR